MKNVRPDGEILHSSFIIHYYNRFFACSVCYLLYADL